MTDLTKEELQSEAEVNPETGEVKPLSEQEEDELESNLRQLNKRTITIRRRIEIDAGHRVTEHESKCKNLHGHRYRIEAMVTAEELISEGSERGMIMDFSFLKQDMVYIIDKRCDHTMMLWIDDPFCKMFIPKEVLEKPVTESVEEFGYANVTNKYGRFYVLDCVPTAENLAKHWGDRLDELIQETTKGRVRLSMLVVWETPNCSAIYVKEQPSNSLNIHYRMQVETEVDKLIDEVGEAS